MQIIVLNLIKNIKVENNKLLIRFFRYLKIKKAEESFLQKI